jgi:hypothetical protein
MFIVASNVVVSHNVARSSGIFCMNSSRVISPFSSKSFARASVCARLETISSSNAIKTICRRGHRSSRFQFVSLMTARQNRGQWFSSGSANSVPQISLGPPPAFTPAGTSARQIMMHGGTRQSLGTGNSGQDARY